MFRLCKIFFIITISATITAGEFKKHVFEYDPIKYDNMLNHASTMTHPFFSQCYMEVVGLRERGTNHFVIFSRIGIEIASITLPDSNFTSLVGTQLFVDDDLEFEFIVIDTRIKNDRGIVISPFRVFDDDGTLLLQDSGKIKIIYNGRSSFLYVQGPDNSNKFITYTLRSEMSPVSSPFNVTSKNSEPLPFSEYGSSGNYNITLQSGNAGETTVQLIDFLGREVFRNSIDNTIEPTIYSIPKQYLPNTPFIAKVKSGGRCMVKKEIPAH